MIVNRLLTVEAPLAYDLSKNRLYQRGHAGGVHLRREASEARDRLALVVRNGFQWAPWKPVTATLYLRIALRLPHQGGDAINALDLVADAVQLATGLDDRWCQIDGLTSVVTPHERLIRLRLRQDTDEDHRICGGCGVYAPARLFGVARLCPPCRPRAGRSLMSGWVLWRDSWEGRYRNRQREAALQ